MLSCSSFIDLLKDFWEYPFWAVYTNSQEIILTKKQKQKTKIALSDVVEWCEGDESSLRYFCYFHFSILNPASIY